MKHLLSNVPIFAGLEDKALEIFLAHAQRTEVAEGALITREG